MSVTVDPPSRRERKKQATREAIHEAALDLVEQHGLGAVTVEDVTERADVAPRTFFNYFSCKEDAVIGREPDYVDALVVALRERPASEPVGDSLRRILTDSFVARSVDPVNLLRRMRVVKSEPLLLSRMAAQFELMEQNLVAEVAERTGHRPDADIEPLLVVALALAACRASLIHWCDQGGRVPVEQVLDRAFDRVSAGHPCSGGAATPPCSPPRAAPTQKGQVE